MLMGYAAVTLLIAVLTASAVPAQSPDREGHHPSSKENIPGPEVYKVKPQPDSPLRLWVKTRWLYLLLNVEGWTERNGYELTHFVENVSDRDVSAYAIRLTPPGGCSPWIMSPDFMQPGKSDAKSTWDSFSPSAHVRTYEVDFVEFADGTTWGADVCQSAERLAGERAGGAAAADRLLELLAVGGPDAVIKVVKGKLGRSPEAEVKSIDERLSDITPPPEHSPAWEEGFRIGKRVIALRIKRSVELSGPVGLEPELRRRYDYRVR
jgi:hypothetical protein